METLLMEDETAKAARQGPLGEEKKPGVGLPELRAAAGRKPAAARRGSATAV